MSKQLLELRRVVIDEGRKLVRLDSRLDNNNVDGVFGLLSSRVFIFVIKHASKRSVFRLF